MLHHIIYKSSVTNENNSIYLLLIHGFMFTDVWERTNILYHFLDKGYSCIKIDLLGFGDSPKPADITYTIEDHVEHVNKTVSHIIKHKKRIKLVGIGYSIGSIILLNLLNNTKLPFHTNIIISPPLWIGKNNSEIFKLFFNLSSDKNFHDIFDLSKLCLHLCTYYPDLCKSFPFLNIKYIKEFNRNNSYATKNTFINTIIKPSIPNIDMLKSLDLNTKILWIHSIDDDFISKEMVNKICKKFPHTFKVKYFEDNHYLSYENSAHISNIIFTYINKYTHHNKDNIIKKIKLNKNKIQLKEDKIDLRENKIEIEEDKIKLEVDKIEIEEDKIKLEVDKIEIEEDNIEIEEDNIEIKEDNIEIKEHNIEIKEDKIELEENKIEIDNGYIGNKVDIISEENRFIDINTDVIQCEKMEYKFIYIKDNKSPIVVHD